MKLRGYIRIIKQLKATDAEFFKDLQPADILYLTQELKNPGRRDRKGVYATYVNIKCLRDGTETKKSLSELAIRLNRFEWEEYFP